MYVSEAYELLKEYKNKNLTQAEFAKSMGSNPVACNQRIKNNSELKVSEAIKLFNAYGYDFINHSLINSQKPNNIEKVEIKYYENSNLKAQIKTPLITSIWFDRELVENVWKKDPKNLRIIKMLGDKMDDGAYPLRNGDILIIDISDKDIMSSGIYVFTTHNDNYIFINGIYKKINGDIKFFFLKDLYPEKIYTEQEAKDFGFNVIGRVIKNLSLII